MPASIGSFGTRFFFLSLIVALLAAGTVPLVLAAAEDEESRLCEDAFSRCLGQAGGAALALDWRTVLKLVTICIAGYAFCEKYVEPYIREGV